jgi:proliferating cell nuclear antigen
MDKFSEIEDDPLYQNNVLTIQTVQTGPIKTVIAVLKDILTECTMTFTKDGWKVLNMDTSKTVVAYLDLFASKFEKFYCKRDRIIIGVNLQEMFKLIQGVENNDILTIFIDNKNYENGYVSHLSIKISNSVTKQISTTHMNLVDANTDILEYPDIVFSSVITMPSLDFSKIIRTINALSTKVEIKSTFDQLLFTCVGTSGTTEIVRMENNSANDTSGIKFMQKSDDITQGIFAIRNLNNFIKATPLSPGVDIYLKNDKPLVTQYSAANLGILRLCLATLKSV